MTKVNVNTFVQAKYFLKILQKINGALNNVATSMPIDLFLK